MSNPLNVLFLVKACVCKVAVRPRALYQKLIANHPDVRVKVRKRLQEWGADLTEVDTDYHVEFAELTPLFLPGYDPVNDEDDEKHLDRKKGKVAKSLDRSVCDIVKQQVMNEVQKC